MRKWLKRIAVWAAVLLLLAALLVAVMAYRANRVPAWYAAAVDCPTEPAHDAEQTQLIGFQNWLARSGAGNPDQLPERERRYEITLTAEQINALLAKWTDNLQGDVRFLRVDLGTDRMTVQGTWTSRNRTVGLELKSAPAPNGRPLVWVDGVRVGDLGLPLRWVNSMPVERVRAELAKATRAGRRVSIDEHGMASPQVAIVSTLSSLLSLAQGDSVEPIACVSPRLSIDDTIPLNLTGLHSDGRTLTMTFQLLTPPEQQALLTRVEGLTAH